MSPHSRSRAQRPERTIGPGVRHVQVELVRRAVLAGLLEDPQRLLEALVAHQRLHRRGVEEDALARALALEEGAGDREDQPEALRVALLEQARAVIALAVSVHVLAVHGGRDLEVLVPGVRRLEAVLLEHVGAVVHHVEVAVDGDEVGLAVDLLVELPEVGGDVVELEPRVVRDEVAQVREQVAVGELDRPAGGEHPDVDRVRSRGPVGEQLLEEVGERHRRDLDRRAGHRLELFAPLLEPPGDDGPRPGEDVDGDAFVLHLRVRRGREGGGGQGRGAERRRREGAFDGHFMASGVPMLPAGDRLPARGPPALPRRRHASRRAAARQA